MPPRLQSLKTVSGPQKSISGSPKTVSGPETFKTVSGHIVSMCPRKNNAVYIVCLMQVSGKYRIEKQVSWEKKNGRNIIFDPYACLYFF